MPITATIVFQRDNPKLGSDWDVYPDAKTIVLIERDGAVMAAAKDMKKTEMNSYFPASR